MNGQANFDQKMTTLAGVCGGALSWVLGNIEVLTRVVSFLGTVCGATVALISLVQTLRRLRRQDRERRAPFMVPPDIDDDLPLP